MFGVVIINISVQLCFAFASGPLGFNKGSVTCFDMGGDRNG